MYSFDLKRVRRGYKCAELKQMESRVNPQFTASSVPAHKIEEARQGAICTAAEVSTAAVQIAPAEAQIASAEAQIVQAETLESEATDAWWHCQASTGLDCNEHDNAEETLLNARLKGFSFANHKRKDKSDSFVSVDLRSAMTSESHSAFAGRVSSSAEQRNFAERTTSAKQWTSADELNNSYRPFLAAVIVLLGLICMMLLHDSVPESPGRLVPALARADAYALASYEVVFVLDQSESMKYTFDCPQLSGIITSRLDWTQGQLENFAQQVLQKEARELSVISVKDNLKSENGSEAIQAGISLGIMQVQALREHPEKPLAIVVLTDTDPASLKEAEQKMLVNSIKNVEKLSSNVRFIFLMIGNDCTRWVWQNQRNNWKETLATDYRIKEIPFYKMNKSGIARTIAKALR